MDSYKKKLLDHLENDIYCRIGVSKIPNGGVGVIAIKDISKGTNPFKNLSKEKERIINLSDNDIKNINPNVKKILKDFFGNQDNYNVLYSGPNYINISYYLNHSDKPNIDIIDDGESEYLAFITNRNINEGEELFINYKDYEKY